MVTKKNSTRGRTKVGKLELNKETVRELTPEELKNVKGGVVVTTIIAILIPLIPPPPPVKTDYCPGK